MSFKGDVLTLLFDAFVSQRNQSSEPDEAICSASRTSSATENIYTDQHQYVIVSQVCHGHLHRPASLCHCVTSVSWTPVQISISMSLCHRCVMDTCTDQHEYVSVTSVSWTPVQTSTSMSVSQVCHGHLYRPARVCQCHRCDTDTYTN